MAHSAPARPVAAVEHITPAGDIRCFLGEYYRDPYMAAGDTDPSTGPTLTDSVAGIAYLYNIVITG